MAGVDDFIAANAKWIITLIFAAGFGYFQLQSNTQDLKDLKVELEDVEQRLDKKIKIINEVEDEVQAIAIKVAVLETT